MGVFTKEVEYREYYSGRKVVETRITTLTKAAIAIGCVASTYVLFGDNTMDLAGDAPRDIPVDAAINKAKTKYKEIFAGLDPAKKFSVQYGGTTTVSVRSKDDGNGLLGLVNSEDKKRTYDAQFNDGCLGSTAYDINGGNIRFSFVHGGLFSYVSASVKGDIPTAAAFAQVDASNPDVLHVASGNTNSVDLTFSGVTSGNALTPANEATKRILSTYGCEIGYLGYSKS